MNRTIVKTCSETENEGVRYLEYNGYGKVKRISGTDLYICSRIGNKLSDVKQESYLEIIKQFLRIENLNWLAKRTIEYILGIAFFTGIFLFFSVLESILEYLL